MTSYNHIICLNNVLHNSLRLHYKVLNYLTFLPDIALRRTPSSFSRPKNCMKHIKVTTIEKQQKLKLQILLTNENLRKLYRAATSLILLLLYMAPIAKTNRTQKQTSRQANQAPSHHVIDPSSNFKEPIHKRQKVL